MDFCLLVLGCGLFKFSLMTTVLCDVIPLILNAKDEVFLMLCQLLKIKKALPRYPWWDLCHWAALASSCMDLSHDGLVSNFVFCCCHSFVYRGYEVSNVVFCCCHSFVFRGYEVSLQQCCSAARHSLHELVQACIPQVAGSANSDSRCMIIYDDSWFPHRKGETYLPGVKHRFRGQ